LSKPATLAVTSVLPPIGVSTAPAPRPSAAVPAAPLDRASRSSFWSRLTSLCSFSIAPGA
jgi:hypothetical protein